MDMHDDRVRRFMGGEMAIRSLPKPITMPIQINTIQIRKKSRSHL
jgi:hypothetical protein